MPFRDAHEAVARAVRAAADFGCDLARLPLERLRSFAAAIESDVTEVLGVEASVAARNHVGGTAPEQVRVQVARWRGRLTPGPR
jgi:argininosuccinate lyase